MHTSWGNEMIFTQYNEQGRILFHGDMPENLIDMQGDNVCLGAESPETHYVVNREFVKRKQSPVRLHGMSLQNIPVGSLIKINGASYLATESVCNLNFTYPGTYRVAVECFPYLDFTTEFVV